MSKIHKNIVLDENQKPVAIQIPIKEFEQLEEMIENYGLAKLLDEVKDDEALIYAILDCRRSPAWIRKQLNKA